MVTDLLGTRISSGFLVIGIVSFDLSLLSFPAICSPSELSGEPMMVFSSPSSSKSEDGVAFLSSLPVKSGDGVILERFVLSPFVNTFRAAVARTGLGAATVTS
jgi:hypothetical protein